MAHAAPLPDDRTPDTAPPPEAATTAAGAAAATGNPAVRAMLALEDDARLDTVADRLAPVADALVADPVRRDALLGTKGGHAVHPVLTDLPLGVWTSATLLDLFGGAGARTAARRLVGIGVLAAAPAAVTGLAEWQQTDVRSARVGVVHAAANSVALALYAASWLARRRSHAGGTVLALAGATAAAVGGFLGGHLALARNVASRHDAFADSAPPG